MSIPRLATALNYIDDDLLVDAVIYLRTKRDLLKTFCVRASIVACACLAVAGVLWTLSTTSFDEPVVSYPLEISPYQTEDIESNTPNIMDIQINEINSNHLAIYSMLPRDLDTFESMTREEVLNYFGITLDLSTILPNMHEVESTRYGFYHFGDGSIYDDFTFRYIGGETQQTVNITLSGSGSYMSIIKEEDKYVLEKSILNDKEILIVHYTNSIGSSTYCAEFIDGDLGVTVKTEDCPVEDLIRTLEYLTQS